MRNYETVGFNSIQDVFDQDILHQVDLSLRRKAIEKFSKLCWKNQVKLFYNLDNRILESKDYETGSTVNLLERYRFGKDTICFEISERHELKNETNCFNALSSYASRIVSLAHPMGCLVVSE